jgi:hypothetical protein
MFFQKKKIAKVICNIVIAIFLVTGVFAFAPFTHAATLFFSDPDTYYIGQTLTLTVYVGSGQQAINAVSGAVSFPSDKMQLISIGKAGSIITFWTQEPSFSNASGKAQFEGVAYNPGYTGPAGSIVTLTFKVKAAGSATLSFSAASVLANDGQGTNVLDSTKDVTLLLKGGEQETPVETASGPHTPRVYSPTHPDSAKWYPSGNVTMKWDVGRDTAAVRVQYDRFASSEPTVAYDPPMTERSFHVDDGIWYFHAQEKNATSWGPITHFKFQVDTEPPGPVSVTFPNGNVSNNPQPLVTMSATDSLSGIDHYDLRIGGSEEKIRVSPQELTHGPYRLPSQDPGQKTLEVIAYDKAGNFSSITVNFEILGLAAPKLDPISDITEGEIFQVSGKTIPESLVTIFVKSTTNKVETQTTRSLSDGTFKLTWQGKLPNGAYEVTAQAVNDQGAKTYRSLAETFAIRTAWIMKISTLVLNFISLFVIVIALILLLIFWSIYLWYKLRTIRERINKKVAHADAVVHKKITSITAIVTTQIERLESAKEERKLTREENAVIRELKKSLSDTEESIEEELEDIKKV